MNDVSSSSLVLPATAAPFFWQKAILNFNKDSTAISRLVFFGEITAEPNVNAKSRRTPRFSFTSNYRKLGFLEWGRQASTGACIDL